MRLLVTGPRDLKDYYLVHEVLDGIHAVTPITVLIEGGAPGTDRFARRWAEERGVTTDPCPVDHALDGPWPAAGPRAEPPKALDAVADVVLTYRPKPKSKPAKKRKRRAKKIAKATGSEA